jgi:transcriptional regulator with XRE-family HTH domain
MMFTERIKQLREECQLPLRKLAVTFDIDSAAYWKIERGKRRAKREQFVIIADTLQTDKGEFADQVPASVANKKAVADRDL